MEARLDKRPPGQKYMVGDSITIIDFLLLGFVYMFIYNDGCTASKPHQEVMKQHKTFSDYIHDITPEVQDYLDKRP